MNFDHRRPFWTPSTLARYASLFAEARSSQPDLLQTPPLVMGLAANYNAAQLAPFVLSLRAHRYSGQIVLLTANLSSDTLDFLEANRVQCVPFDIRRYAPFHVQNSRFFFYLEYLLRRLEEGTLPRAVFLTDVRDVVFQGDPFGGPVRDLEVFYENDRMTIGQCPMNTKWIRNCFGAATAAELERFHICCSGTTLGTGAGVLEYLIQMWNAMSLISEEAARSFADQASQNLIVHRGLVDGLVRNGNGARVLTLHYVDKADIRLTGDGKIVNADGVLSPIVHQYDRHPILAEAVADTYRLGAG